VHAVFFEKPQLKDFDALTDLERGAILKSLADDPSDEVRKRVARGILDLPKSTDLIDQMRAYLGDSNEWVRLSAVEFIHDHQPPLIHMAPDLVKLLNDPNENVQELAQDTLGMIGTLSPISVIPDMVQLLQQSSVQGKIGALQILSRMRAAALPTIPPIMMALQSEDSRVREAAVQTLGSVKGNGTAPQIVRALTDPEQGVRDAALLALGNIGPEGKDAVPILLERLRETPNENLRQRVEWTLNRIDPEQFPMDVKE
jgi:HEAT repeat protein